jgi:phage virion morphogenesis protein
MGGQGLQLRVPRDLTRFQESLVSLLKLDYVQLNKDLANALRNSTLTRFKKGVDPEGEAWPPSGRAESEGRMSKEGKAKAQSMARFEGSGKTISGKTLVDTGRLKNSITTAVDVDEIQVGTNVVYARIHQLGGEEGKPNATMPKRPYLGLSKDDEELVAKMIELRIKKIFEGGK